MMVWPLRTQFRMMKYKDGENEDGAIPSLLETFFLILATPLAFHIKAVLIPMVDKIPAGCKKNQCLQRGALILQSDPSRACRVLVTAIEGWCT